MTPRQKHEKRRAGLNAERSRRVTRSDEIAGLSNDAMTTEIREEAGRIDTEIRNFDAQITACDHAIAEAGRVEERETIERTANVNGNGNDGETRERRELRGKTGSHDFVTAAVGRQGGGRRRGRIRRGVRRTARGATCRSIICESLRPFPGSFSEARQREDRAITPGVQALEMPAPTVPFIFDASVAASLGVLFPTVAAGAANYPTITTAPPADTVAKDADAPSTAAVVALATRTPKRVTGLFEIRREDLAVMPSLETDLLQSIGMSVRNEMDEQIVNGTDAGGDLNGLFKQATDVAVAAAVETFASGVSRFAALVDGQFARGWSDLRAIIGPSTFAKYEALYANANKGDISLFDRLAAKMGSLRVSDRIAAVASMGQKALVTRMAMGEYAIRVPTWGSVEIVRDIYSLAGKGQIRLTAILLCGDPHVPHGTNQVVELHPKVAS